MWRLLHASALCAKHDDSGPLDLAVVHTFLGLLPEVLPCPGCKQHCHVWTKANPPSQRVLDGESFWAFTVDLHNAVNRRLNRVEMESDMAEVLVLEDLGCEASEIRDVYLESSWHVLMLFALTFDGDTTVWNRWLQSAVRCCSMTHGDSGVWVTAPSTLDPESRLTHVLYMRNKSASMYGMGTQTLLEVKTAMQKLIRSRQSSVLLSAMRRRQWDHKQILTMQASPASDVAPASNVLVWVITVLILVVMMFAGGWICGRRAGIRSS